MLGTLSPPSLQFFSLHRSGLGAATTISGQTNPTECCVVKRLLAVLAAQYVGWGVIPAAE